MTKQANKPASPFLSGEVRAAIKACQGSLSQAAVARKFGVSRRTVGRIFHGGELSVSSDSMRQQLADLTETVKQLSAQISAQHTQQRFRPALNPDFHKGTRKSHGNDYSSPYRDQSGIILTTVNGIDVPVPYDWRDWLRDTWFASQNPVSPSCEVYPYPMEQKQKQKAGEVPEYRDPPAGVVCQCEQCREWRLGMAFEYAINRSLPYAIVDLALFRSGHRR